MLQTNPASASCADVDALIIIKDIFTRDMRLSMKLHRLRSTDSGVASFGCIWNQGQIPKDQVKNVIFHCTNEDGMEVDIQSRITAYWPDKSIKWTAHCVDNSGLGNNIEVSYEVSPDDSNEDNNEERDAVRRENDHEKRDAARLEKSLYQPEVLMEKISLTRVLHQGRVNISSIITEISMLSIYHILGGRR